jgi:thymidylate kinase
MLVCVVGADGAGKSTVTKLAAQEFARRGVPIERVDRWDIVGNPETYAATRFMRPDVADTRLCVAEMPNPPRLLFLMWSIGMALLGRSGEPGEDAVTLLDGYWMKHAASEIVYGLDRSWVEAVTSGLPAPDAVVYLRLDPQRAWERKRDGDVVPYECGMDPDCGEGTFLAHQGRIQAVLDDWSATFGWTEVDADQPIEDVVSTVVDALARAEAAAGRSVTGV